MGTEGGFLRIRVVQFSVSVGDFHTEHVTLEAFSDKAINPLSLGERTQGSRIVVNEDWLIELSNGRFHHNLKEQMDEHRVIFAGSVDFQFASSSFDGCGITHIDTDVLHKEVGILHTWPGFGEVDDAVAEWKGGSLAQLVDQLDHQRFCQLLHCLVVAIRLVEFHHRELRVVLGTDAFVTENAAQFIDLIEPCHQQFLERKFQGDAEEQWNIKCIVVCCKRACGSATSDVMQHRGFHFKVTFCVQELTNALEDLDPYFCLSS